MKQHKWTKSDVSTLIELLPNYTYRIIGEKIGVSESAVEHKVKRLGLNRTLKDRLYSRIRFGNQDDCWNWVGCKAKYGYGVIGTNRGYKHAHRVMWELYHGVKIYSSKIFVCHKCDNPSCCNPNHLFLGTHKDNMQDKTLKGRGNNTKLKPNEILEIRKLYRNGTSQRDIAETFCVDQSNISYIVSKKTWRHIE